MFKFYLCNNLFSCERQHTAMEIVFVAGSISSTNSVFCCCCRQHFFTPFQKHNSPVFSKVKLWPRFGFWAVHARTILFQNLLCDSFQRGTLMPCYQVWTIELSILIAPHSVSHEKISLENNETFVLKPFAILICSVIVVMMTDQYHNFEVGC